MYSTSSSVYSYIDNIIEIVTNTYLCMTPCIYSLFVNIYSNLLKEWEEDLKDKFSVNFKFHDYFNF